VHNLEFRKDEAGDPTKGAIGMYSGTHSASLFATACTGMNKLLHTAKQTPLATKRPLWFGICISLIASAGMLGNVVPLMPVEMPLADTWHLADVPVSSVIPCLITFVANLCC